MKAFTEHPRSVNESYFQHLCSAASFSLRMLRLAICCVIHGVFPFVFAQTGSREIKRLHELMVTNRMRTPPDV
ncbi:MAG: hypothetical protein NPIRA05_23170 [Nitrospirales bacterium]|nr:MAG: hypothetical protein NPIRA05_23170 [Nitrospirales bacterium]